MSNSIGRYFRVTSFGESHGFCVGTVVDGCPAGLKFQEDQIQHELDRRRPGQSHISTKRCEEDRLEILSGVFNGITTGAPICMIIRNQGHDPSEYEERRWIPRPGHADYTAYIRYGGFNDYRGGGRFSGRITAGFVMAGALGKMLLNETLGVEILGHTVEIGGVVSGISDPDKIREHAEKNPVRSADPEAAGRMIKAIEDAALRMDSVGGSVECIALDVPPGLGDPTFEGLEANIAKALFSIPAAKSVCFGLGDGFSCSLGSQINDPFTIDDDRVVTTSNNMGGVLGGISSGMPLRCRVTFKPTPSIGRTQRTVNLETYEEIDLKLRGRHDPCIVPRAVPVVESMVAVVLADQALSLGLIKPVLDV